MSYQPVSQPQGIHYSLLFSKFGHQYFHLSFSVLPVEKQLFTQTLQPPASQPSTVCTPSEMITTPIPQNEKTVSVHNSKTKKNQNYN